MASTRERSGPCGFLEVLNLVEPAGHPVRAVVVHHPSLTLSLTDQTVLSRAADA